MIRNDYETYDKMVIINKSPDKFGIQISKIHPTLREAVQKKTFGHVVEN